jgi:hypothetical protein
VTLVYNFRYQDVFVLLAQEILVKMQFKHNQVQLEELDDETLDDDVSHESKLQCSFGLFPSLDLSVFFISMYVLYKVYEILKVKCFV